MRLKPILTSIVALALLAWPAAALECSGRNLFDSMSPERMAELRKATDAVPYHTGLFWQADKGDMRVTLIGTYHFDDPRHDATMAAFGPVIDDAAMLDGRGRPLGRGATDPGDEDRPGADRRQQRPDPARAADEGRMEDAFGGA